jgi:alkylmercury lyase
VTAALDPTLPLHGQSDELALQRAGLAAIRTGQHLTVIELGVSAGLEPTRAQTAIDSLLARQAVTVTGGRVDGIAGLTTRLTPHTLTIDGHDRHTWCAFDAVGIPAALRLDAVATTRCGHCTDTIHVAFTAGQTPATEPWGWLPSLDCCGNQLIDEFCSSADLFCNRDDFERWHVATGSPAGEAHPLGALVDIGRAVWDHCR